MHADGTLSASPLPIVVSPRELRARVDLALQAGERHLAVDCEGWREPDVSLLSALIHCAHRSRQQGAVLDLLNLSGEVRASMRDLRLEERLGLT
jgi:anti-anti-sigma regulatory factor